MPVLGLALGLPFKNRPPLASGSLYGNDFVFTVQTTGASETFTIPCNNIGTFNATIDWGDGGATSAITTYNDADLAHIYATADTYTVRISGTFPNIYFNNAGDKAKVKSVIQLGDVGWQSLGFSFFGCGITSFTAGTCNTTNVADFSSMVRNCASLVSLDLTGMDTSSATSMGLMMYSLPSMTSVPDLSGFDTSNVTSMDSMLRGWTSAGTIGNIGQVDFDIHLVTNLTNFMNGTAMSTAAYDALLIAWEAQTEQTGLNAHFGTAKYTSGGAAETARGVLTATSGWTITDGGPL